MTKPRTRDRLVNWGRYWRDHNGDFGRCRSIEHRYLREYDPEAKSLLAAEAAQEEQASKPPAPEMRDAIVVNEAWKRCRRDVKQLLKWSHCMGRVDDEFLCQRLRIPADQLSLRYAKALRQIEGVLDTPNFEDRIRLDNSSFCSVESLSVPTETPPAPGAVGATAKGTEEVD